MKRLLPMLTGALLLAFAATPLLAQHPRGGGASGGAGNSGATGAAMHGASGDHGNGGGSANANGNASTKGATASSPTSVLTRNTKLDTHLTSLLQTKGLLPKGTDLKDACAGFKNLGQCVAAVHVSHNLNIPFACLSADMTGTAPASGSTCPSGTGTSKMSFGKSIQTLSPNAAAKTEEKTATKQANDDINEAGSESKS
ncbi:MAG TPA: hypothetical protein VKD70_19215 [Candidatus Acidoferrum sp.]|nr:hypothetical protein [Candidatus Acidoferrum sp.]